MDNDNTLIAHHALQVYDILESLRIGTLPEGERAVATDDPYATDPQRHEAILERSKTPYNAETPPEQMREWLTPTDLHYIRNHMPVPDVLADALELKVCVSMAMLLSHRFLAQAELPAGCVPLEMPRAHCTFVAHYTVQYAVQYRLELLPGGVSESVQRALGTKCVHELITMSDAAMRTQCLTAVPTDITPRSSKSPLQVIDQAGEERGFTLKDLKTKFPKETVTVTLQCAGNRRNEMSAARTVKGLPWDNAAISNAQWAGVRLSTILKEMGVTPSEDAKHIQFVGLDCDMNGALQLAPLAYILRLDLSTCCCTILK